MYMKVKYVSIYKSSHSVIGYSQDLFIILHAMNAKKESHMFANNEKKDLKQHQASSVTEGLITEVLDGQS